MSRGRARMGQAFWVGEQASSGPIGQETLSDESVRGSDHGLCTVEESGHRLSPLIGPSITSFREKGRVRTH